MKIVLISCVKTKLPHCAKAHTTIPYDLRAFISMSDYEDILNGTRKLVLELILEARKKA
jgi:hypothetical protein